MLVTAFKVASANFCWKVPASKHHLVLGASLIHGLPIYGKTMNQKMKLAFKIHSLHWRCWPAFNKLPPRKRQRSSCQGRLHDGGTITTSATLGNRLSP